MVDEETAPIVQRIFDLCVDGFGPSQIARILTEENILTPRAYNYQKTGAYGTATVINYPTMWAEQSVAGILEDKTYLGHTVVGKSIKPSYKSKYVKNLPPDQHKLFPNTHEPFVDEETFNLVQKIRANKRRLAKVGGIEPFSGLLYCSDCGRVLYHIRAKSLTRSRGLRTKIWRG